MYAKCWKRVLDICLSALALTVLSPVLVVLTVLGAIFMKGNPFFTQQRPGKDEKIFRLIKFRTMTCEKDADGNLLPDEKRLNRYGRFLRSTSLDELPELVNILVGNMSLVGPRPLLVEYLPYYTETERRRHSVRPGLTGLAQVNGRNFVVWDQRLALDCEYVSNITFASDCKILLRTIVVTFKPETVAVCTQDVEGNLAQIRQAAMEENNAESVHVG